MTSEKEVLFIGQGAFLGAGLITLFTGMKNGLITEVAKWILIVALIATFYSIVLGLRNSKTSTFYISKIIQFISTLIISIVVVVAPIFGKEFIKAPDESTMGPLLLLLLFSAIIIIAIPLLRLKGKEIFD